jgi:hypothetical protein
VRELFAGNAQDGNVLGYRLWLAKRCSDRRSRLYDFEAPLSVRFGFDLTLVFVAPDDEVKELGQETLGKIA